MSASGRLVVYPPSAKATTYSALVSTLSMSVSTETPRQLVPSLDHLVTQWMSTVTSSAGRAWNSSHVQWPAVAPDSSVIVKSHCSSDVNGVGPADAVHIARAV